MIPDDLFLRVERAKSGDREAMEQIIDLFQPAINRVCLQAHPNERNDLRQALKEKVIVAVKQYDLASVPDYSAFIEMISTNWDSGL
ncbi:helix-turn-helix domain-containing protein [Gorillibacterium timonense]|uniref:helix-turn-helix domain-containing protein n=1 Tax=Gorillibacterium timonense TaxID=1689269 RepID=UPI00071E1338|nr:helix-turn-helix domain-containing protein [Gorillibacterium timonense]